MLNQPGRYATTLLGRFRGEGFRLSDSPYQDDVRNLILVRHGESMHHRQGLAGGWTDATLTDLGRQQARLTAQFLKANAPFQPTELLGSDLRRAVETASVIGAEGNIDALSL